MDEVVKAPVTWSDRLVVAGVVAVPVLLIIGFFTWWIMLAIHPAPKEQCWQAWTVKDGYVTVCPSDLTHW